MGRPGTQGRETAEQPKIRVQTRLCNTRNTTNHGGGGWTPAFRAPMVSEMQSISGVSLRILYGDLKAVCR